MQENPYASPAHESPPHIARVSWQKQLLIFAMLIAMLPSALCAGILVAAVVSPAFSLFFASDIAHLLSGALGIVAAVWSIFCFLSSIDRLQRQELAARSRAAQSRHDEATDHG